MTKALNFLIAVILTSACGKLAEQRDTAVSEFSRAAITTRNLTSRERKLAGTWESNDPQKGNKIRYTFTEDGRYTVEWGRGSVTGNYGIWPTPYTLILTYSGSGAYMIHTISLGDNVFVLINGSKRSVFHRLQ